MTVGEVESAISPYTNGLEQLSDSDIVERLELVTAVLEYEQANKDRKTATGAITDVRDGLRAEARPRGLLTQDEADAEAATEDADEGDDNAADDADDGDEDLASGDAADADDDSAEAEESAEPEDEEPVDRGLGPMEERDQEAKHLSFSGNDGRDRILVRNPGRTSANIAGFGFQPGEVKDLVVDDKLRKAIRRNKLQVVKG
ncbi:hypothetical protein HUG10_21530 (plasmid) [Halorarum halophilum]|uniref:Uncharacterized protein n=1 Tax=Halorarum halophilum TaxID=2743090 RepID=A0A7D5GF09_9EURY|nr:hypothetical protein [Halobaculum halophilum]QLG30172.1 hypothetical protein HUG10_21530 [Halobaculum halophilum]